MIIGDNYWFNEYMKFIDEHRIISEVEYYCEKHHIYPRKLYPSKINDKTNIVKLRAKDHLKAHLLLYKCLPNNPSIIYSLNMMVNRGKHDDKFNISEVERYFDDYAEKYEDFRIKVAKIISENNTGYKPSEEVRQKQSELTKGTVVVKDKNGNMFRTSIDDKRYKCGELIYYRCGYKHKNSTKEKMSMNGIKGLHAYNNGKEVVYSDNCPDGFVAGILEETKEKTRKYFLDRGYYYNPITDESIRLKPNEPIPKGFIKKRKKVGNFVGFDKINETIRCYNIDKHEIEMINKKEIDFSKHIIAVGLKLNSFIKYDDLIFTNVLDLSSYIYDKLGILLPKCFRISMTEFEKYYNNWICKPSSFHKDCYDEYSRNFYKDNKGKRIMEIFSLTLVKKEDIIYGNDTIYVSKERKEKYGKGI